MKAQKYRNYTIFRDSSRILINGCSALWWLMMIFNAVVCWVFLNTPSLNECLKYFVYMKPMETLELDIKTSIITPAMGLKRIGLHSGVGLITELK